MFIIQYQSMSGEVYIVSVGYDGYAVMSFNKSEAMQFPTFEEARQFAYEHRYHSARVIEA